MTDEKRRVRVKRLGEPKGEMDPKLALEMRTLIEESLAPLQERIKRVEEEADSAHRYLYNVAVILGDMRSSVSLATSSAGSTKATLNELLEQLERALDNVTEYLPRIADYPGLGEHAPVVPDAVHSVDTNSTGDVPDVSSALDVLMASARRRCESLRYSDLDNLGDASDVADSFSYFGSASPYGRESSTEDD